MEIFIQINGVKEGPFAMDQIRQRIETGSLAKTSLAWHEGLSNWMPVLAVLTPRSQPPPFREMVAAPPQASTNMIGFKEVVPLNTVFSLKPWNLSWVRWSLAFILILLFIQHGGLHDKQSEFFFALEWAAIWALGLHLVMKPQGVKIGRAVMFGLISTLLTVASLVLASRVPFINSLYQATNASSALKRFTALLSVTVLQQILVVLPFWWIYVIKKWWDTSSAILFYGMIAGLAVGLSPTITSLVQQEWSSLSGESFGFLDNGSLMFTITHTILSGFWVAILTHFVLNAKADPNRAYVWVGAGVLFVSSLTTLYFVSSSGILSAVIVAASILVFATYLKTDTQGQNAL